MLCNKCKFVARDLIDTWWNVNIHNYDSNITRTNVLIDTWWNVNINFSGKMAQMTTVLIDTWWNVNENTNLAFMEIFAF